MNASSMPLTFNPSSPNIAVTDSVWRLTILGRAMQACSLADLPVDVVKLDIALVREIDRDPRRRAIALGMIKICQELEIEVVAEGVERASQIAPLADAGVRLMQGFLFARPRLNGLVTDAEIHF